MTLDGLTMHYIVEEVSKEAVGCKIDKVQQPRPDTIILSLRSPGKSIRLLISAAASDSRLHITNHKFQNPKTPPMFCMFLRKHITGAKIKIIEQDGLERIIKISFEAKDELGLPVSIMLIAELMGKYSNIILVNPDGTIMESLRHITQAQSRVRSVLPGLKYEPPISDKLNPFTVSETTLTEMLEKRRGRSIKGYITKLLQGVSSPTAEEVLTRYMPSGYQPQPKEAAKLAEKIKKFFNELAPDPCIYMHSNGTPFFYSVTEYISVESVKKQKTTSVNILVDEYYYKIEEIRIIVRKRDSLKKRVSKQFDKLSHIMQKQLESIEKAKKAEEYKNNADIITANIYRIKKGMDMLSTEDFSTGESVNIQLNTKLSPAANAQAYYKRYAKLKAGLEITIKRMLKNKNDIEFLESVLVSLDSSETIEELDEIEFELRKTGFIKKSKSSSTKGTEMPSVPNRFTSSDGYTIYAGKNNRQNDILTMKTALPDDIWLHTKDIPGSHVIISGVKQHVPDKTLFEAATIAATLSKAKLSSKVSVDYTKRKNVKKPGGSKPGKVVYENYKTIIVNPDRELFERLKAK